MEKLESHCLSLEIFEMDNSNWQLTRHTDHLAVNKRGKKRKESSVHQENFGKAHRVIYPIQPHVSVNINDFRNIVQQLTDSPSRHQEPPHRYPPKPPSLRLQRIRPPPLTSMVIHSSTMVLSSNPGDDDWLDTHESPISAYMRYLQHSKAHRVIYPLQPQNVVQQLTSSPSRHREPPHQFPPKPPKS